MSKLLAGVVAMCERQQRERKDMGLRHLAEYAEMLRTLMELAERIDQLEEGDGVIFRDELYQIVNIEKGEAELWQIFTGDIKRVDLRDLYRHGFLVVDEHDYEDGE